MGPGGRDDHLCARPRRRAAPTAGVGRRWAGPAPRRARRLPRPAAAADQRSLDFPMALEDGEWRIAEAPDALIVPESWFEQRFRQVSLYFFDPSAPDPGARAGVRASAASSSTTALTEALLRGPGPEPRRDLPQLHPARARLRPVGAGLRGGRRRHRPARLLRTADARGQRADDHPARVDPAPGARRSRRSGSPSAASRSRSGGGQSLFDVDAALGVRPDRARLQPPASTACDDGLLVSGQPDDARPGRAARWASPGSGARSFAVNLDGTTVAAVARPAVTPCCESSVRRPGASGSRRSSAARERPAAPGLGLRRPAVAGRRAPATAPAVSCPRRQRAARGRRARVTGRRVDHVPGLPRRLPAGRRRARPRRVTG